MKMIRWSGLIAFVVIVGFIVAFTLFFLDGIIKRVVEDQASLLVGAKVEIGDLRFKLFGLRVDIQDIQVANPEQPMRNIVEVGASAFDLAAAPLLKKKIVIEEMKVEDLAWNTARKTSGALPARLQKKLEARKKQVDIGVVAEKRLEDCVLPDFSALTKLSKGSPEGFLKDVPLSSAGFIADYRKKVSVAKEDWEKRLAELPKKEDLENQIKALENLKDQRPRDFTQLPSYLEKLKTLQQNFEDTRKKLTAAQQDFQREMNLMKSSLKEVEKLKDQDLKTVMAKMGIQVPSAEDLVCVLLGKDVARKVNRAIAWYRKLNQFMHKRASKTDKERPKPEPRPRLKGVDVRFPVTRGYPDFLLEKAEFSVRSTMKMGTEKLSFSRLAGELQGLTTHPALYGKPTRVNLQGSLVGEIAKEFSLSGLLDHRTELADDRIQMTVQDLKIGQTGAIALEKSPLQLVSANLDINADLRVKGDNLNGRVLLGVQRPEIAVGSEAAMLANLFKNLGAFDMVLSIGGTLEQPSLKLSSSATKTLASGMQNLFQAELKGLQSNIRKAIASRVDGDLIEANRETDVLQKLIQGELSSRLGIGRGRMEEGTRREEPSKKLKPFDFLKK